MLLLGKWFDIQYFKLRYFPYISFATAYLAFTAIVFPFIEKSYRNHDKMGTAIIQQVPDIQSPLLMDAVQIHNMPYYTQRKIMPYLSEKEIFDYYNENSSLLGLIPREKAAMYEPYDVIWEGLLYEGSEARILEFVMQIIQHQQNKHSLFREYYVIYKNKEDTAISIQ